MDITVLMDTLVKRNFLQRINPYCTCLKVSSKAVSELIHHNVVEYLHMEALYDIIYIFG